MKSREIFWQQTSLKDSAIILLGSMNSECLNILPDNILLLLIIPQLLIISVLSTNAMSVLFSYSSFPDYFLNQIWSLNVEVSFSYHN